MQKTNVLSYIFLPSSVQYICELAVACRALNQAIGRCIRHKHDYGGIILLDRRFGDVRNRKDLSCWYLASASGNLETIFELAQLVPACRVHGQIRASDAGLQCVCASAQM